MHDDFANRGAMTPEPRVRADLETVEEEPREDVRKRTERERRLAQVNAIRERWFKNRESEVSR